MILTFPDTYLLEKPMIFQVVFSPSHNYSLILDPENPG